MFKVYFGWKIFFFYRKYKHRPYIMALGPSFGWNFEKHIWNICIKARAYVRSCVCIRACVNARQNGESRLNIIYYLLIIFSQNLYQNLIIKNLEILMILCSSQMKNKNILKVKGTWENKIWGQQDIYLSSYLSTQPKPRYKISV